MSRPAYLVAALLAAGFLTLGLFSLRRSLTPYVGIEEARRSPSPVQVAGVVDRATVDFDGAGALLFDLCDAEGRRLPVRSAQPRPSGFDEADQVVVAGAMRGDRFEARQILVKCPSKYEGAVAR